MKFRIGLFILNIVVLIVATPIVGYAKMVTVKGEQSGPLLLLESVVKHGVLVQRNKEIEVCDEVTCIKRDSDLRVSYVLIDNGPSTDVSPRYGLYLTTYNYIEEHAVASSLHRIAYIQALNNVSRTEAGIYNFSYKILAELDNLESSTVLDCAHHDVIVRLDARDLTTKVRRAKMTKFFENAQYNDPIFLTVTNRKCAVE